MADQLAVVAEVAQLPVDDVGALIAQLKQWIAEDKKVTPLKVIQGLLWREGYESGVFQGHIYDDAFDGLTAWKEQNIDIKPWRNKGNYILLCLQNPTDTSLNDLYTPEMKDKLINKNIYAKIRIIYDYGG